MDSPTDEQLKVWREETQNHPPDKPVWGSRTVSRLLDEVERLRAQMKWDEDFDAWEDGAINKMPLKKDRPK